MLWLPMTSHGRPLPRRFCHLHWLGAAAALWAGACAHDWDALDPRVEHATAAGDSGSAGAGEAGAPAIGAGTSGAGHEAAGGQSGSGGTGGACADDTTRCGDECVSLLRSSRHCGSCDAACGRYEVCADGDCTAACAAAGLRALFVVADANGLGAGDAALVSLLEHVGFEVAPVTSTEVDSVSTDGVALVLISSTAQSNAVGTRFSEVDVPVVCWDSYLYDDLGLTGPQSGVDYSAMLLEQLIRIVNPAHPLAAGLDGAVRVYEQGADMAWGAPAGDAEAIATGTYNSDSATILKLDPGDARGDGSAAPARRLGIFLGDSGPSVLTEDGERLVLAAFCWTAGQNP